MKVITSGLLTFLQIGTMTTCLWASELEVPIPGTYVGYTAINGQNIKIPVSLEVLRQRDGEGQSNLIAFFKLMLGGFRTHEYIVQEFNIPNYDWKNPYISLDANASGKSGDISIEDGRVLKEGHLIEGIFTSVRGGFVRGSIQLVYWEDESSRAVLNAIYPERPVIPAATGSYEGKCIVDDLTINKLQIEAVKAHTWEKRSPFALSGYNIYGRFGMLDPLVADRHPMEVVYEGFDNAVYDFYQQRLEFPKTGKRCSVSGLTLACGPECSFTKRMVEGSLDQVLISEPYSSSPKNNNNKNEQPIPFPYADKDVAGTYHGSLHLEFRNQFEPMMVHVSLVGAPGGARNGLSRPKVSIRAEVFTAGFKLDNHAFMAFLYEPAVFPEAPFDQLIVTGDSDSVMEINAWTVNGLHGILYSKSFGRVGSFELQRGGFENNFFETKDKYNSAPLAGTYIETITRHSEMAGTVTIGVFPSVDAPEYYPFEINGRLNVRFLIEPELGSVSFSLNSGYYDPFTGVFALLSNDFPAIIGIMDSSGFNGIAVSGSDMFLPMGSQKVVHYGRKNS